MKWLRLACVVLALAFATSAGAKDKTQFMDGEAFQIDPAKAYVVLREVSSPEKYAMSIVLVRLLDSESYASVLATRRKDGTYTSKIKNVFFNRFDGPYAISGKERLYVFEVTPGDYVVAGTAAVNKNSGPMTTCLCMGTVGFHATAGRITDLGTFLTAIDNRPAEIPELASLVRGENIGVTPPPYVTGLHLPENSSALPASLASGAIDRAEYHPVDKFPNVIGGSVERLAPVPGILGYRDDEVIDMRPQRSDR